MTKGLPVNPPVHGAFPSANMSSPVFLLTKFGAVGQQADRELPEKVMHSNSACFINSEDPSSRTMSYRRNPNLDGKGAV